MFLISKDTLGRESLRSGTINQIVVSRTVQHIYLKFPLPKLMFVYLPLLIVSVKVRDSYLDTEELSEGCRRTRRRSDDRKGRKL